MSKARMVEDERGDVRLSLALDILRAAGLTSRDLGTILRDDVVAALDRVGAT